MGSRAASNARASSGSARSSDNRAGRTRLPYSASEASTDVLPRNYKGVKADSRAAAGSTTRVAELVRLHVRDLMTHFGWRAGAALLLLLGTGFLEGAGLLLLVPLLGAVGLDVQQGPVGRLAAFVTGGFTRLGLRPSLLL